MGCIPTCMGQSPTFITMIVFTAAFFLVEIIVGYVTNSMALVADSFHMLSDIISLLVGFFALKISRQRNGNLEANTFGWVRAEVLGALINAVFLVALCFSITVEAIKRMVQPERIERPILVLILGATGLFINLIGLLLFHGHAHGHSHSGHGHAHNHTHGASNTVHHGRKEICNTSQSQAHKEIESRPDVTPHVNNGYCVDLMGPNDAKMPSDSICIEMYVDQQRDHPRSGLDQSTTKATPEKKKVPKSSGQMNMKGVYLHVLGDAFGSLIVIIASLIIYFCRGTWTLYVDPSMSILMVIVIMKSSLQLLRESSMILLQRTPDHIQLGQLETRLLGTFPEIIEVHEFHVWQLAGNKIVASLHIKFLSDKDYKSTSFALKEFFHDEGIHSTTVQPEFVESGEEVSLDKQCLLRCGSITCEEKLCCRTAPIKQEVKKTENPALHSSREENFVDFPTEVYERTVEERVI